MKLGHLLCGLVLTQGLPAVAQIYAGVSNSGSIVLSSSMESQSPTLLIEAPPEEIVQSVVDTAIASAVNANIPAPFLPYVQEASRTYQLPSELIHAVISVESNYNPRAISPKGAQGLMQLMPATARRFGLINHWDPRQNILTGSHYLRWLLDYFNQDLMLSLAAYNAGEGAVMRAGRRIPPIAETQNYVPKVLSIYKKFKRQV